MDHYLGGGGIIFTSEATNANIMNNTLCNDLSTEYD